MHNPDIQFQVVPQQIQPPAPEHSIPELKKALRRLWTEKNTQRLRHEFYAKFRDRAFVSWVVLTGGLWALQKVGEYYPDFISQTSIATGAKILMAYSVPVFGSLLTYCLPNPEARILTQITETRENLVLSYMRILQNTELGAAEQKAREIVMNFEDRIHEEIVHPHREAELREVKRIRTNLSILVAPGRLLERKGTFFYTHP
jgi:hypothetical protein